MFRVLSLCWRQVRQLRDLVPRVLPRARPINGSVLADMVQIRGGHPLPSRCVTLTHIRKVNTHRLTRRGSRSTVAIYSVECCLRFPQRLSASSHSLPFVVMSSILASLQDLGLTNNQLALVGAGVGTVLLYAATRKPTPRHPPGPPGKPLIGNMLDYPSGQEWVTFDKWQKQYGDIVYCDVAGTKIVVLNSVQHIKAIFEERGSVSSERPSSYFANEMLGWKLSPIMHGSSHEWFKPCELPSVPDLFLRTTLEVPSRESRVSSPSAITGLDPFRHIWTCADSSRSVQVAK